MPSISGEARGEPAVGQLSPLDRGPGWRLIRGYDDDASGENFVRAWIVERYDSRVRVGADLFSATERNEVSRDGIGDVVHELRLKVTETDTIEDALARFQDANQHVRVILRPKQQ